MDIGAWLRELGLERYEQAFRENEIDDAILAKLTAEDLNDIGVTAVGHRRKLLEAIAALGQPASALQAESSVSVERAPRARTAEAERRQLTVMFIDLVGSTKLAARLDPEDVGQVIRSYQECCTEVIGRWDGHVAKYMGDGVLVYFGYPQAHEDDVERAVHAGLEVTEAVRRLTTPAGQSLEARVGIATGLVVVGDLIGKGAAQEEAVVGETPNLAARLQGVARPGGVAIASDTRRLLGGVFDLVDLGEHTFEGFETPITTWQVVGEAASESRFEALRRRQLTPLVGRDDELELLARRWQRAKAGEGQVVLISGDPGIGKSRLCEALRERIAEEPHTRLAYQCSAHRNDAAFHPMIRQLEHAAGIRPEDNPTQRLDRLKTLLRPTDGTFEEEVAALAVLLSIPPESGYAVPKLGAQQLQDRIYRALFNQLESLAAEQPLLVVFEDLHWADPSTLDLLDRLVERVAALPVLILLTVRPSLTTAWRDQAHVVLLNLNRISERECRALVRALAGQESLPQAIMAEITTKSDGIPLFVEELTQGVLEARRRENADEPARSGWEVPASLQDSLMARLDRLTIGKPVAQTASVLGREFTLDMLRPICALGNADLDNALDELVGTGLLNQRGVAPNWSFVFKHALVQDAAYSSLLRGKRRQLHRRAAETLGDFWADQPGILAHHWERAEELDNAVKCRFEAGERAAGSAAPWEGTAHYWHALGLLERLPETEVTRRQFVDAVVALVNTIYRTGIGSWQSVADQSRTDQYIDKAIEIVSASRDMATLARLEAVKGNLRRDATLHAKALQHAAQDGDQELVADVEGHYAGHLGKVGQFEASHAHLNRAIEIYGSLGAEVRQAQVMAGVARCYYARAGNIEGALDFARRAREISDATGDPGLKSMLAMEAEPYFYKGLWRQTVDVVERDLRAAWEFGNWAIVLWCSAWATISEIKLGRLDAARSRIENALHTAGSRVGEAYPMTYTLVALGQVRLADGQVEAALNEARRAVELSHDAQLRLEQGAAHRTLGQAYEVRGDRDEAEAQFRQSLDILAGIQSRPELAQSMLAYGRFKLQDDEAEGRRHLSDALAQFKEMDAVGWIEETRDALGGQRA